VTRQTAHSRKGPNKVVHLLAALLEAPRHPAGGDTRGGTDVRVLRIALLLLVLVSGGVGGCLIHRAVLSWEGGNIPPPAKQRELDILEEYAKEMDALFERHGRALTEACQREQEALREATRKKLADAGPQGKEGSPKKP
jgi:hypothetical protein